MTNITEKQRQQLADAFASVAASPSGKYGSLTQNPAYPKPTVTVAPAGVLDPLLADPSGVAVEVAYLSMTAFDIIGLSFNGDDSFAQQMGSIFQKVTFQVPASAVATAVGKTVRVIYAVVLPDGTVLSEVLDLVVQPIPVAQLPTPQITQATGGELDVSVLSSDADVTVAPWPLIAVGQRLWLRLEGSTNLDLPAWQASPITSTGAQSTRIPLSYLQGLADGSALKLVLEVSFDDGITKQAFPTLELKVQTFSGERVENFDTYPSGQVTSPFKTEYMTFRAPEMWFILEEDPHKMTLVAVNLSASRASFYIDLLAVQKSAYQFAYYAAR